jgi:hypothetical protein
MRLAAVLALVVLTALPRTAERAVLWRDPGHIAALDLSWSQRAPVKPPAPPFRFVKEDTSGTRAKVHVKDANGVEWNVKLAGNWDDTAEVHAEVAAGRIVWALGYFVEPGYYVPGGTIEGVHDLHRAARGLTPDGHFRAARFKPRPTKEETTDIHWTVLDNPFRGTRELSGLMILMTMLNNWDLTGINDAVLRDEGERHYLVSDLGASFGHMENVRLPWSVFSMYPWTKWNVRDYQAQRFLDGIHDGRLRLHFRGEVTLPDIPLEHARWFCDLVSQLTPAQIRQAFASAGATPDETTGFAERFEQKVRELAAAVGE